MRKRVLIFVWLFVFPLLGGVGVGYAQIISTVAGGGNCGSTYCGDGGIGTSAELNYPTGVTFDAASNLYIADELNHRIRKVNTVGIITTVAGTGFGAGTPSCTPCYLGDGGQATAARLNSPADVAIDAAGNLYIADAYNHCIRIVNTAGVINTFAGTGSAGYNGDGIAATAAELYDPNGLAFDGAGNLYISDSGNRVRMVNTAGIISTVAGNGFSGFSGDSGQAINAEISATEDITVDAVGNLYIADFNNNRVRKVNTSGIISTIAGNGTFGHNGDGGPGTAAELDHPGGVTCDILGNVYISDYNDRIRKVNTAGIISMIVGNGTAGFSGDNGVATAAEIYIPIGLVFDNTGNLYIADAGNSRIRKVTNAGQIGIDKLGVISDELRVWPNPAQGIINLELRIKNEIQQNTTLLIADILGNTVRQLKIYNLKSIIDISDLNAGVYFLKLETTMGIEIKIIIKN